MHAPALHTASKTNRVSSNSCVPTAMWSPLLAVRAQDGLSTTPYACAHRAVAASRLDAYIARALRLCRAAQRIRSTWDSQGQRPRKTEHEHGWCGLRPTSARSTTQCKC